MENAELCFSYIGNLVLTFSDKYFKGNKELYKHSKDNRKDNILRETIDWKLKLDYNKLFEMHSFKALEEDYFFSDKLSKSDKIILERLCREYTSSDSNYGNIPGYNEASEKLKSEARRYYDKICFFLSFENEFAGLPLESKLRSLK